MIDKIEYSQMSEIEHILHRPDMYTGKIKDIACDCFTYYPKSQQVKFENITYNCGVAKLFDEIFTNAIDNIEKKPKTGMQNVNVTIDSTTISVKNDGKNTIEIRYCTPKECKEHIYLPELIFTRPRSGSNFDDSVKRTYGGKNGIGSKLAAVFSKHLIIDICHSGKRYLQHVYDNCSNIKPPKITEIDSKDYVHITFEPDFARFGCKCITKDTYRYLCKRVHDCSHIGLNITINEFKLPQYDWDEYVCSYPIMSREEDQIVTYVDKASQWKIALTTSSKSAQTSTVNGVNTIDGGTHVKYILEQVRDYINNNVKPTVKPTITRKSTKAKPAEAKKSNYTVTQIASHTFIIISAIVVNPDFKDQAKTELTTEVREFKNVCVIPPEKLNVFVSETHIIDELEQKTKNQLLNGMRKNITAIEKYEKANKSNAKEGYKCTLFLCEGNSAKTMCMSGLNIIGHDYYGVYPLRGKVLNTRKASLDKYCKNREIQDMISIIGLDSGKEYTTVKGLNYGRIVCMKDADSDGADIMGLIMNFFETKFKSLTQLEGFFNEFITPMIQVRDDDKRYDFYNEVQYKQFMEAAKFKAKPQIRFLKGLASNKKDDITNYFNHYTSNTINILFDNKFEESLDKAFNDKRANDRKVWMEQITPDTHLPREVGIPIHVDDFIDRELVMYSMDACVRSIPSIIDGLKPVQRKILHTLFNDPSIPRNKNSEIKVYEFVGNVAKFAKYHHGNQSLEGAVIKMAQTYPGSNNIALVENSTEGFGTRLENGNDCGQSRYIMIKGKVSIARLVFPEIDDHVLVNWVEDNEVVEPTYYIPIIPMVLVNGATGVGMGWSTDIPLHSAKDCIKYVYARLQNKDKLPVINAHYNGYIGQIEITPKSYMHSGVVTIKGNTVRVTEIPIGMSISHFKDVIVKVLQLNENECIEIKSDSNKTTTKYNKTMYHISNTKINGTEDINQIDMELTFDKYPRGGFTESAVKSILELESNVSTTNMVAFNKNGMIHLYKTITEIVNEWFDVRYECYVKRKQYMIQQLELQIKIAANKTRFIKENIEETLDYKNKSDDETDEILFAHEYEQIAVGKQAEPSFDYLLAMQIRTFTKVKYEQLCKELENAKNELKKLKNTSESDMWLSDLEKLDNALSE